MQRVTLGFQLFGQIHRFGPQLAGQQEMLRVNLLPQLDIGRAGLRKRAIACIGVLPTPYTPVPLVASQL